MSMQRKNYDSEFCGSLPLNFINQVQPYGILLVLDKEQLNIIQVSANIDTELGLEPETVLDTPLGNYILPVQLENLKQRLSAVAQDKLPFTFTFDVAGEPKDYLSITHSKEEYIILELERIDHSEVIDTSFLTVYQELRYTMSSVEMASTTVDVCNIAIGELKRISGFDRIMIYQFDEEWNGTVIAEVLEEGMEPYLGLRFPASDIPKQARALYERNPYRQIPDRNYTPIKLYPVVNPLTQTFTDLADCNLRSVAAVHLEYLKNMNVVASMSTRIIKDNKLWGLISCHHREARFMNYEKCAVFELLSGIISGKIGALKNKEDFAYNLKLQDIQASLVEQLYSGNNLFDGLLNKDITILNLLNVTGVVIAHNRRIATAGNVPTPNEINDLILWLQSNNIGKVYHTSNLSNVYDNAAQFGEKASGMIVLPIQPEKGEFIIGFRPEVIQQVSWGGNPNEAINFEADKKNYHPRNSFRIWQQTVKHTSVPWHNQEIAIAENFRNILLEFSLKNAYA